MKRAFFAGIAIASTIFVLGCSDKNAEVDSEVTIPTTNATSKTQPLVVDEKDDGPSELGSKLASTESGEKDKIQPLDSESSSEVLASN